MEQLKLIGDAIRKARTDAAMSQTDLATLLGVTKQAVSLWETTGNISTVRIAQVFKALNCHVKLQISPIRR